MKHRLNSFLFSNPVALGIFYLCLAYCQTNVQQLPEVGIYYAKLYGEPIANESKNIIIDWVDEDAHLGLQCFSKKAVRWVYEDNVRNQIQVSFSILDRRVSDINDENTYRFEAGLEIIFKYTLVNHTYVACVAYEDDSLITVVSGINVPGVGTNFTVMDDMESQNKKAILSKLIPPVPNEDEDGSKNCSINFLYQDNTAILGVIYFLWTPVEELTLSYARAPNILTLENAERNTKQIERRCISPNDSFTDKVNKNLGTKTIKHAGLIFAADSETEKRTAKGFFSVAKDSEKDRHFYFSWDHFPESEMYHIKGIPSEVYEQEKISISCSWSPYFFTNGIVIRQDLSNLRTNYHSLPLIIPEDPVDFGTVVSQLSLTIEREDWPIQNITVHFPVHNSSKWVSVPYSIKVKESKKVSFVNDSSEELTFTEGEKNKEVVCIATGIPSPEIEFNLPRSDVVVRRNLTKSENVSTLTITFPNITTTSRGNYSCVAYNFLNEVKIDIEINVKPKGPDTAFSRNIFIIFGAACSIFIALTFMLFLIIWRRRKDFQKKTDEAIAEFLAGTVKNVANTIELDANHEYNSDFEVPHNNWSMKNDILGQGSFAIVVKGYVTLMDGEKLVAIKKIMSPSKVEDFKCALYELKLMAVLEPHPNIVQLIAACTDNIHQRKIMLALEYCINGDLLGYMKLRSGLHVSFVKDGQIDTTMTGQEKEELKKYDNIPSSASFNTIDLYKWSFQTANGMSYLESKKIVHGDLAARNLLLSEDKTIKISDFGLARQMSRSEGNMVFDITHEAMPWKWMALECLKDKKLSAKSDIWSYGIVLWEIFSLGEIPYPGYTLGPEFINELEKGLRMGKTKFVSDEVYDIMVKSWSLMPQERPSFEDVKFFFMPKIGQMWSAVFGKQEVLGDTKKKVPAPNYVNSENAYCVLVD